MFSANTTQVSTAATAAIYIEDVFSTYLYTGNGSTQTITNGIDLSGKGGLVWIKGRTIGFNHALFDTARGVTQLLQTDNNNTQAPQATAVTAFNSNGFASGSSIFTNFNTTNYASWTFREQPKFFDIVTYTGTGANRTIAHNLGSVPGCIFVKRTDAESTWCVYHNSLTYANGTGVFGTTKAGENALFLNTIGLANDNITYWNNTDATSANFSLGTIADVNANGGTYVAYLFANNAGGFGASGLDNVISCSFYVGNGTSNYSKTINLGWEPQFVLVKRTSQVSDTVGWGIADNMRGFTVSSNTNWLLANTTAAESTLGGESIRITNTGFNVANAQWNQNTAGYIYIAIRRGPMKTPTVGTSVYTSASRTGTASVMPRWVAGFPVDWAIRKSDVTTGGGDWQAGDRLRGAVQVKPNLTEVETAASPLYIFDGMTGYSTLGAAGSDSGDRSWMFRRAPGFFDVVCYTGDGGSNRSLSHNLMSIPELIFFKRCNGSGDWIVSAATQVGKGALLNTTDSFFTNANAAGSSPWTQSTIYIKNPGFDSQATNGLGDTYVAYLFATVAGVSKVGSYTGTGATLTVNCGFTTGARFVLIKRTDSTGDWYVWDSARGIITGNDPYLLLNSSAAEVTSTNYVDTDSTGFKVTAAAPAALNASGGTYIFLAIA